MHLRKCNKILNEWKSEKHLSPHITWPISKSRHIIDEMTKERKSDPNPHKTLFATTSTKVTDNVCTYLRTRWMFWFDTCAQVFFRNKIASCEQNEFPFQFCFISTPYINFSALRIFIMNFKLIANFLIANGESQHGIWRDIFKVMVSNLIYKLLHFNLNDFILQERRIYNFCLCT